MKTPIKHDNSCALNYRSPLVLYENENKFQKNQENLILPVAGAADNLI